MVNPLTVVGETICWGNICCINIFFNSQSLCLQLAQSYMYSSCRCVSNKCCNFQNQRYILLCTSIINHDGVTDLPRIKLRKYEEWFIYWISKNEKHIQFSLLSLQLKVYQNPESWKKCSKLQVTKIGEGSSQVVLFAPSSKACNHHRYIYIQYLKKVHEFLPEPLLQFLFNPWKVFDLSIKCCFSNHFTPLENSKPLLYQQEQLVKRQE